MSAVAPKPIGSNANTQNWDTVFALRVSEVNKDIVKSAKAGKVPKTFKSPADHGLTISGNFDPWRLSPKGSDHIANIILPISKVDFIKGGKTILSDTGLEAHIEIHLEFVTDHNPPPQKKNAKLKGGKPVKLVAKTQPLSSVDPRIAKVLNVTKPNGAFVDSGVPSVVQSGIENWLQKHLADFQHIFTRLRLNSTAAKGDLKWLIPTDTGYAFGAGNTVDDAMLAVLCTTNGRKAKSLVPQVSAGALRPQDKASFVIGSHAFMQDVLLPAMPKAYKGTKVTDYKMDADGLGFSLIRTDIKLDPVTHDGKTYAPVLKSLTIRLESNKFTITGETATEFTKGIIAHTQHTSEFKVALGKNKAGQQTLHFVEEKNPPDPLTWNTTTKGMTIAQYVAIAIAGLCAVVLMVCSLGGAVLFMVVATAVAAGLVLVTPTLLNKIPSTHAEPVDAFLSFCTEPITWADGLDYTLTGAELSSALRLSGKLA